MEPLTDELGYVLRPREPQNLAALEVEQVLPLLKQHGVLVFRDFGATLEDFEAFVPRFEGGPNLWTRSRDVNPKQVALHMHSEQAEGPFPPAFIWFYCVRPARQGGRTTVCDGVRLLNEMDPSIRELFSQRKLLYRASWKSDTWQKMFPTPDIEQAALMASFMPGMSARIEGSDTLYVEHVVSAIRTTKFGGQQAFVNSVLHSYDNPPMGWRLTFEEGVPIPREVVENLRELSQRIALPLTWRAGDFAAIDNTRLMHGREAFDGDSERLIRAMEVMASVA
ncbi:TauD/TfdA family dioxygenase [Sorangium sp. So ce1182]|uniref:TauD/TfdA family dioxygenase n=1 Tax=Sorangium sp. So ce1182 TaxID=3133334 RepID=UPI003F640F65